MKPNSTTLDPVKLIATIEQLRLRIQSRFPDSGLLGVCEHCMTIAEQARARAEFIDSPIYWLRAMIVVFVVALFVGAGLIVVSLPKNLLNFTDDWQTIEALTSETLLLSAGLFFLVSLEKRFKRRRALSAIHELRALAHVVDMHQLTKDPERLLPDWINSEYSPSMTMNAFELGRYLDYCNEMLSLIGKLAAVYIQRFDDEVALEAVTEVEMLTASLCDRIWQKIMFLNAIENQLKSSTLMRPIPSTPPASAPNAASIASLSDTVPGATHSIRRIACGNYI